MNPVKKGTEVTIAGRTYKLVFDFDAIAEAEEITGKSLITGLRPNDVMTPKVNLVRAMFFASASATDPALKYDDAKRLITRSNLAEVWLQVILAWKESSPEEEGEVDENPTTGQS